MSKTKLTDKQKVFCKEYIIDFNATRSAEAAGYSKKTARHQGSENLAKPYIQDEIARLMKKRNERTEVTADTVVNELAKIGFIKKENGVEGYSMEFDSKDKIKALEMLARHVGAFNKDESNKATIKVSIKKPGE